MSNNDRNPNQWATRAHKDAAGSFAGSGDLRATMMNDYIRVFSTKASAQEDRHDVTFRVTLMKLPEWTENVDYVVGDINGDGVINKEDLDLLGEFLTGKTSLTDRQMKSADVNRDGEIDTGDTLKLSKYVNGIISTLD